MTFSVCWHRDILLPWPCNVMTSLYFSFAVSLQQGESASECYCLSVREGVNRLKVVNIGSLALQWRR